jgi:hypothetical protein
LQTFFPTLTKLFRLGKWNRDDQEIWMDNRWRIVGIDCSGTTGPCSVKLVSNSDLSSNSLDADAKPAFLKATHLLDPIHFIRGEYSLPKESGLPWHHKASQRAWQKLQDPGNQAYIDSVASYALGRLREEDVSPHFNVFYGSFCAKANLYQYNLTEDFQSYRHERWFWKGFHKKLFKFNVVNHMDPGAPVSKEVMDDILQEYADTNSDSDASSAASAASAASSSSASITSEKILEDVPITDNTVASIHSDSMSEVSFAESEADAESDTSESHTIYAEIPNFPVMLIITEQSEGTMDELFEDTDQVGCIPGSAEWELRWSAWLFQVIAALSAMQTLFGMTHNDLHTNNILWSTTTQEYLVYTTKSGNIFRVPTFGKIFKIIDFGRAIFTINKYMFISDDFKSGNDADGQYVFSPLCHKFTKEIPPNPSFDLSRLAVSIIDGIFPKKPKRKSSVVLSKERGLTVFETNSPLYNLLWSWMIDDDGRNIYINPDGSERFPSFDLYKHIGEFIHTAIPSQQIFKDAFAGFQVMEDASSKKYSLYC